MKLLCNEQITNILLVFRDSAEKKEENSDIWAKFDAKSKEEKERMMIEEETRLRYKIGYNYEGQNRNK
jgi:hypothetical protein